jgi:hypothetical protein
MSLYRIIDIPSFSEPRGTLSAIESGPLLPFNPVRLFFVYGVHPTAERGCHALKSTEELIIPMAGGFTITVDDGYSKTEFELNRPDKGLYIPPMTWHVLRNFAPGTVCGVLASKPYDQNAYYRVYDEFMDAIRKSPRA